MRRLLKWTILVLVVLVLFIVFAVIYCYKALPDVGSTPDIHIELTPERVERGKYLAHSVAVCMDCHSRRDWSRYSGPIVPGTEGGGGEVFDRNMGFPGVFYSRNITPYGLGNWTDGELYQAITIGVNKAGEPLFPVMPYHYYGAMQDEDIYAIIAYIRTLPAIASEIPEREIDFPFNLILRTIPVKRTPVVVRPPLSDTVAYGKYLTNAASCMECHTKAEKGQLIRELAFAGGREFELPGGTLRSTNLTPHETGLGYWSRERFIQAFKQYQDTAWHSPTLSATDFNTLMPWMMYSTMTEADLGAIYLYLRTLDPLENEVDRFTPGQSGLLTDR